MAAQVALQQTVSRSRMFTLSRSLVRWLRVPRIIISFVVMVVARTSRLVVLRLRVGAVIAVTLANFVRSLFRYI